MRKTDQPECRGSFFPAEPKQLGPEIAEHSLKQLRRRSRRRQRDNETRSGRLEQLRLARYYARWGCD